MLYLSIEQVIEIHRRVVLQSGDSLGIRDRGALESSVLQPLQVFGDRELYPSLVEKAAALGYFLIQNHPFVDGNKRVGHAVMETLLLLNGTEVAAPVDEQEAVVLSGASGQTSREQFTEWARSARRSGGRLTLALQPTRPAPSFSRMLTLRVRAARLSAVPLGADGSGSGLPNHEVAGR